MMTPAGGRGAAPSQEFLSMRYDERFHAALRDPQDPRPLLLASNASELAIVRRLVDEPSRDANIDRLALRIGQLIASALGNSSEAAPLYQLASWAAAKLGSPSTAQSLEEADEQIVELAGAARLDAPKPGEAELSFAGGGDSRLLHLAITLARLRHKKLKRLRRWRGVLDRLVGRERRPSAGMRQPVRREPLPSEVYVDQGEADGALWDIIKGAAGRLPLSVWEDKLRDARKDVGRFNIIVAGRTGVGKTTLIGAIFGKEVGDTLMGRPRTRGRVWYPEQPGEADILRLCDTEGLEMERYKETLGGLEREIEQRNSSRDPFDHIHVAWLCIDEPSLTVQPGEEALVRMLDREGIPVIAVLTKAGMAPQFKDKVAELLPSLRAVVRVRAQPIIIEGHAFQSMGIDELLRATEAAIPDAVETAWHVASRNLTAMLARAETTVRRAAAAAGAAGATPIPLADAAGVFGVQVGMIVAISLQMGVKLKRSDLQPMAMTLIGALGLTAGGRFIAGQFAKLIPGLGTVAGSAITGSTAAAITYGLGRAYIEFLRSFFGEHDRMPNADELALGFQTFWRRWKNKEQTPPVQSRIA
jgi:uncharacterized protein (DUF697 family)/GTP-binding protein EngB required for normal cell division